jgi:hypothetical protein
MFFNPFVAYRRATPPPKNKNKNDFFTPIKEMRTTYLT